MPFPFFVFQFYVLISYCFLSLEFNCFTYFVIGGKLSVTVVVLENRIVEVNSNIVQACVRFTYF